MKSEADPQQARDFALDVVRRLRQAGFQALWAGGCVRDRLLGLQPKDYDVATDATPPQIREIFGRRRTLAIGQAFGVIIVLGPPGAGQIDVATFRRDSVYSDGRHPDHVSFSSAAEDAQRRDFTLNGLFFDPVAEEVIDYVGGRQDLELGMIRAIGDPYERFSEDRLRMIRAVRFAATFDFQIEPRTLAAIRQEAGSLTIVSAERIAAELRRMLEHDHRRRAVELLRDSGLLTVVSPEMAALLPPSPSAESALAWQQTLEILDRMEHPSFAIAFAALFRPLAVGGEVGMETVQQIGQRLRLSNEENAELAFVLRHEIEVRQATRQPWPRLQRVLIQRLAPALLTYAQAVAEVLDGTTVEIEHCRRKLALPPDQLNPPPLITGEDLRACGFPPGPIYRKILEQVRDAQLDERIQNQGEALSLAHKIYLSLS